MGRSELPSNTKYSSVATRMPAALSRISPPIKSLRRTLQTSYFKSSFHASLHIDLPSEQLPSALGTEFAPPVRHFSLLLPALGDDDDDYDDTHQFVPRPMCCYQTVTQPQTSVRTALPVHHRETSAEAFRHWTVRQVTVVRPSVHASWLYQIHLLRMLPEDVPLLHTYIITTHHLSVKFPTT